MNNKIIKKPEKQKADTIHLLLNGDAVCNQQRFGESEILFTYDDTAREIRDGLRDIYTTVPHFLNFKYAKRLFVHVDNDIHEITIGKCDGTTREISESTNIEKLLYAGEFDWWVND